MNTIDELGNPILEELHNLELYELVPFNKIETNKYYIWNDNKDHVLYKLIVENITQYGDIDILTLEQKRNQHTWEPDNHTFTLTWRDNPLFYKNRPAALRAGGGGSGAVAAGGGGSAAVAAGGGGSGAVAAGGANNGAVGGANNNSGAVAVGANNGAAGGVNNNGGNINPNNLGGARKRKSRRAQSARRKSRKSRKSRRAQSARRNSFQTGNLRQRK
jgi:hypothetical protein